MGGAFLAVALAAGGILEANPLFFAAAWTFAALPWAYLIAAALHRTAGPARIGSVVGIAALILVLAASTVVAMRNCVPRVEAGADLAGCDLSGAELAGMDLGLADLTDANLRGADLRGTRFTRADLSGADLRDVELRRTSFAGASLEGANLRDLDLTRAVLEGAALDGATLDGANLAGSDLTAVSLAGASLRGADLTDAVLADADLTDAVLEGTRLESAFLVGARGLGDEVLVRALGVGPDELAVTLIERDIRLEDQLEIREALGAACRGEGVEDAAPYPTGAFHPMVILGDSGALGTETDRGDELGWEPMAVRFAQLVACVQDPEQVELEVCPYQGEGQFGTITRIRNAREFRVVEAATGRTVLERTLEGTDPKPCPATHVFLEADPNEVLAGSAITFRDIQPELEGLVR